MDPLSITASTIALATALKDIIGLAQAIRTVIDKVPKNNNAVRKLADDVLQRLVKLGTFYEERKLILADSPELTDALHNLTQPEMTSAMRATYNRCCELFPQKSSGTLHKALSAFKAWSKCNEIEAEIRQLKEDVQSCYIQFTALAVARLESSTSTIVSSTTRIQESLLVLNEQQRNGLTRLEGAVASLQISVSSDESTSNAPQNISAPLTAVALSAQEVGTLYLHQQIEAIAESLDDLASSRTFATERPDDIYLQPFKTIIIDVHSQRTTPHQYDALQRQVVADALEIIRLLQDSDAELSVQAGAWDMVNLAIRLHALDMYSDAVTIGTWTVDLYRTLYPGHPNIYEPYLALALRNLSRYYIDVDDIDNALNAIEECVQRQRTMPRWVAENVRLDLANSLIEYWGILLDKDKQQAYEAAREALDILDGIRDEIQEWDAWIQSAASSDFSSMSHAASNAHLLEGGAMSTRDTPISDQKVMYRPLDDDEETVIRLEYNTGRALHAVSSSLSELERYSEAYHAAKRGLNILLSLQERCPGRFDDILATLLVHISKPPVSNAPGATETPEERLRNVTMAEDIYRSLIKTRPRKYRPSLLETLWDRASLLYDLNRHDEAKQLSLETLELVRSWHRDNRLTLAQALTGTTWYLKNLKLTDQVVIVRREAVDIYRQQMTTKDDKPSDAASNTKAVADQLYELARDLRLVGQSEDAMAACVESVGQYRRLVKQLSSNNDENRAAFARALAYQAYLLNDAGQSDNALDIANEAVGIYDELVRAREGTDQADRYEQDYVYALFQVSSSAVNARHRRDLELSNQAVDRFRHLLSRNATDLNKRRLMDALRNHEYVLGKHDLRSDCLSATEELLKMRRTLPIENAEDATKLASALLSHSCNLDSFVRRKEGLQVAEEAISVLERFWTDNVDVEENNDNLSGAANELVAPYLSDAYGHKAAYLGLLGKESESLANAITSAKIARKYNTEDTELACRLRQQALCLQKCGRLAEAIELGGDAVELCRHSRSENDHPFCRVRLPHTLESLSMITAESGNISEAIDLAKEAVDLYREFRTDKQKDGASYKRHLPWAFVQDIYLTALMQFPLLRLVSAVKANSLSDSAVLQEIEDDFLEVKSSLLRTLSDSPLRHTSLARLLDMLSSFLCITGRIEEALVVAKDLGERISRLEAFDPELGAAVRWELKDLRVTSIMGILNSHPNAGLLPQR